LFSLNCTLNDKKPEGTKEGGKEGKKTEPTGDRRNQRMRNKSIRGRLSSKVSISYIEDKDGKKKENGEKGRGKEGVMDTGAKAILRVFLVLSYLE